MGELVINGGNELHGKYTVQGAKNSVLPLFAAAVLADGVVTITNVPLIADVTNMLSILRALGVYVEFFDHTVRINASILNSYCIPDNLAKELRSSVFLLGSVLARKRKVKVAYPGGCDIGLRPIDIHIKALRELNVFIEEESGYIYCDAMHMNAGEVNLDYPSVGATENLILASIYNEGCTIINNAASEPEIVDLQNFLNKMGAKVFGAGTSRIKIYGVNSITGTEYRAMPDRISAGTIAIATAICGGDVRIYGGAPSDMRPLLSKMAKTSCIVNQESDNIHIVANKRPVAVMRIVTQPHPGFPTDLQAPFMALQTVSEGTCVIRENVFENRFRHVPELRKMGADIIIDSRTAIVKGVDRLNGATVFAQDLRGGAALVLAGLNAKGVTYVKDVYHIDRGYENIEETLSNLGADIKRI